MLAFGGRGGRREEQKRESPNVDSSEVQNTSENMKPRHELAQNCWQRTSSQMGSDDAKALL